ncbi:flagellin [Methylobacterium sp. Leaf85]|uniref:flagellin n=1 Tax=Methylobacterium sp. Leaf85 TaxID=1736241 RepID=UPI003FCECF3B
MNITTVGDDQKMISAYMKIVDATAQQLLTGASVLGSMSTLLKSQQDFTQQLMDINTSSIGSLVDANIEEESTKLKALQTQQQLGVQALSIANSSSQNVLSLFR